MGTRIVTCYSSTKQFTILNVNFQHISNKHELFSPVSNSTDESAEHHVHAMLRTFAIGYLDQFYALNENHMSEFDDRMRCSS